MADRKLMGSHSPVHSTWTSRSSSAGTKRSREEAHGDVAPANKKFCLPHTVQPSVSTFVQLPVSEIENQDIGVPRIKMSDMDYKCLLNEWAQANVKNVKYILEREDGPDHRKHFTVCVLIDEYEYGRGYGNRKRDAEQDAARVALIRLNVDTTRRAQSRQSDNNASNIGSRDSKCILNDWVQSRRKEIKYELASRNGPDHAPRFIVNVIIDGENISSGEGRTIQKAECDAAGHAIQKILKEIVSTYPRVNYPRYRDLSAYDELAMITHNTFDAVTHNYIVTIDKESVVAAIILENSHTGAKTVLSLGSGNVFIDEESLSDDGLGVIDSHAEIIARRGLQRVLYQEIESLNNSSRRRFGILKRNVNGKFSLAEGVKLHLYISKAPCGDGSIFTLSQLQKANTDSGRNHTPVQADKRQGLLRAKIARGEGAIPVADLPSERLHKMSCSDKICKWNVLGLQGALLSRMISEPVYLSSVVLGGVYDFNHLSRSLCCRVQGQLTTGSWSGLCVNHPDIGYSSKYREPDLGKSKPISVNWNIADRTVEVTNGRTGKISSESYLQIPHGSASRLCKNEIFKRYKSVQNPGIVYQRSGHLAYEAEKQSSVAYQDKKEELYQLFENRRLGSWKRRSF